MWVCATCGQENPNGFKFCGNCGAPLAAPAPAREVRKVVTIVFCDLTGSTALGHRTDPEALRATMRGYYDEMRTILERHGGTVEKFVGGRCSASRCRARTMPCALCAPPGRCALRSVSSACKRASA